MVAVTAKMQRTVDLVGIGVATVDVLALVSHLPEADEVLPAAQVALSSGGPVATALAAAAKLGHATAIIDAQGDDWQGELIRNSLRQAGIGVEHILTRPGCLSALSSILVRMGDGARSIVFHAGNASALGVDELPFELLAQAKILHMNGRHIAACLAAADIVHAHGGMVSFDGGHGRYRPEIRPLIQQTDLCIVAAGFARAYMGASELSEAARSLLQSGPTTVIVTDGVKGSTGWNRAGECWEQSAFLMAEVIDTTGCGDAYHGAFLAGHLEGMTTPQAMALASAVAALNTRALGGRDALPTRAQAQAFLDERAEKHSAPKAN